LANNFWAHRSLETGEDDSISWKDSDHNIYLQDIPDQPPSRAAFLAITDDILLAVGYRNHPVLIWSVYDQRLLGMCESDVNNGIDDIAFNPNPDIVALVVSYNDGNLCVFDYVNMALAFTQPKVFAHSIACSSDGRSLVTGSNQGTIEVFEFDQSFSGNTTLTLIYRINAFDDLIRGVIFSPDGLRFVDVRGQQCRVWAPAALVRKDNELESTGDVVSLPPTTVGMLDEPEEPEITCPLEVSTDGGCVIAGKSNGDVALFSTIDGQELGVLYRHARGASIVSVALSEQRNQVISADDSGRVLVAELTTPLLNAATIPQRQRPSAARVILDRRFGAAVVRVLVNAPSNRLLVSGHDVDELWELPSGRMLGERLAIASMAELSLSSSPATASSSSDTSDSGMVTSTFTSRSIFQHPINPAWLVIMTGDIARIFCWADFVELTSSDGIQFERPAVAARRLQSPQLDTAPLPNVSWSSATASYHIGPGLVVELFRPSPSASPYLYVWPAATFDPSSMLPALPATEPNLDVIGSVVLAVLGFVGASTLVFLDVNLWVCSTELRSVSTAAVPRSKTLSRPATIVRQDQLIHSQRHFFALSEWRTTGGELLAAISVAPRGLSRNFVFASGHLVVVVKNGLNFSEGVAAVPVTTMASGNGHSHGEGSGGQHMWKSVSGSMHRRASNW
jgi:WD40 repeat protein